MNAQAPAPLPSAAAELALQRLAASRERLVGALQARAADAQPSLLSAAPLLLAGLGAWVREHPWLAIGLAALGGGALYRARGGLLVFGLMQSRGWWRLGRVLLPQLELGALLRQLLKLRSS